MAEREASDHERDLEALIQGELTRQLASGEERIAAEVESRVLRRLSGFRESLAHTNLRFRRRTATWGLTGFVTVILLLVGFNWRLLEEFHRQRAELTELRTLTDRYPAEFKALHSELTELRTRSDTHSEELNALQAHLTEVRALAGSYAKELDALQAELGALRAKTAAGEGSGSTGRPF
jgi:hypothetical protein